MSHAAIRYTVMPANPAAHLFHVDLTIAHVPSDGLRLSLPAWIPGSYMVRDFARNIVRISARSGDGAVTLDKRDKQSWQLTAPPGPVTVSYEVYAWDLSVRSAHLDQTHGFFNGTSLFLKVHGHELDAHQVDLLSPEGEGYADWRVATTMPVHAVNDRGFGLYQAPDYEALVDYPVEMGTHSVSAFDVEGVPHRIALSGRHDCDQDRLGQDLAKICALQARMFGELPLEQYLFMSMVTGDGYGGLEHRDSTSLMCARDDLPRPGLTTPDEGYTRYLGLCSHEYFHLWNVKRIRPERLKQAKLDQEAYTQLLWAFEGFTSYYDDLFLVRSGCIDATSYLNLLAQTITRVMRGSGRHLQSVAESSFDAWTKFYKQDENSPNAIVSYYAKGALVALGLDIELRDATAGGVTLDDLMRALWQRHGKPDIGVPEDGIEQLASELAGSDLSVFFARYVYGTEELPLEHWLASLGVGFALVPAEGASDTGRSQDQAPDAPEAMRALGARWSDDKGAAKLSHVLDDGAAQAAGLSAGDRIIAVDGLQAGADNLAKRIANGADTVTIHAFRRDELMAFSVTPQPAPADTARLWLLDEVVLSEAQRARRAAWLSHGQS